MVAASSFTAFHPSIFFFNDTATTEIYTLSLHDALPISHTLVPVGGGPVILCTGLTRSALVALASAPGGTPAPRLARIADSASVTRVVSEAIEAPSVVSAAAPVGASLARFLGRGASAPCP